MDPLVAVGLACFALIALLCVRVPVALSLMVAGFFGIALLGSTASLPAVAQSQPFSSVAKYSWTVVPMFILMGAFATESGLLSSLFRVANRTFSRVPGGVGLAAVAACGGFAAVSGSSVATAASIGPIAGREMYKAGYRGSFAAGLVASAGTLGVLIPPSLVLVIYGMTTGDSIAALLVAGIAPGILSAAALAGLVVGLRVLRPQVVMRDQSLAVSAGDHARQPAVSAGSQGTLPAGGDPYPTPLSEEETQRGTAQTEIEHSGLGALVRLAVLFFTVLGGIYLGVVTVVEAAALGAAVALAIAVYDVRALGWRAVWSMIQGALHETARSTGMLFFIVVGASVFTYFLVLSRVPMTTSEWVLSLGLPPLALVAVVLLVMIPLGMVLDPISIILIVIPIAYPIVVVELGFSGIWFAILVVKMIELGLITPPIGLNIFIVSGVMKGIVTTEQAFRGVGWFVLGDLVVIATLFAFPDLVTMWIPAELR